MTADLVQRPDLAVARMLISGAEGSVSTLDIHYLVAAHGQVESFRERHELGLFAHEAYEAAFDAAGLTVTHYQGGPLDRGLYVGANPGAG